jgi:hypothetical protein
MDQTVGLFVWNLLLCISMYLSISLQMFLLGYKHLNGISIINESNKIPVLSVAGPPSDYLPKDW